MRYLEKIGNEDGDWVAMSYVDGRATPDGQRTLGVPAARECVGCHGGVRDRVLGVSAVQLDAATIATLASDNRFTRDVREAKLPGDARDVAALGYLHANCAHCHNQHRPASTGPRCYDPRAKMSSERVDSSDAALSEDEPSRPMTLRRGRERLGIDLTVSPIHS